MLKNRFYFFIKKKNRLEALINSDINEKTNPILIMGANSEARVFEENTLGTNNLTENTGEFRWIHLYFSIW